MNTPNTSDHSPSTFTNAFADPLQNALPPDRSQIDTEQRLAASQHIDQASIADALQIMHAADQQVLTALAACQDQVAAFISAIEKDFLAGGRLIYLGAGTSGRLGVLDAAEIPPTFCVEHNRIIGIIAGGDTSLRHSSEGMEDDPNGAHAALSALDLRPGDSILGIAAGGSTPYVRGAFTIAKQLGASHSGFISCAACSMPADLDHLILCPTGAEVITGSTRLKAGTACKLLLNRISTLLMLRSGHVYQNLMVDVKASNEKLRDRAARIIMTLCPLERPAAFALLAAAHGQSKVAVVMHHQNCTYAQAQALLAQHHGQLGSCIHD